MAWRSELPYIIDSSCLFEVIVHHPWAMFLDSGYPQVAAGRWDILTADPYATILTRNGITECIDNKGIIVVSKDPFSLVRQAIGPQIESIPDIPFAGGVVGWFGYDLVRIKGRGTGSGDADGLPDLALGVFDWAVVVDHKLQRTWLVSNDHGTMTNERWSNLLQLWHQPLPIPTQATFRVLGWPHANMSAEQYRQAFKRIHQYIYRGDCYQVNFAQRFTAPTIGNPWPAYKTLRELNPAPFSAYLSTPYAKVLSSSPERFLRLHKGQVQTQPIKGTRPRGITDEEDRNLGIELTNSSKERAENLMIVDLLRNDLGRVCVPGSIQVPQLFALERYATVQHLVSTITGRLASSADAIALLQACLPGGSVTGAPKIRSMQIIEELEPQRRGIYCGAIGYLGFDGNMDTNIAIRTLIHSNNCVRFWAGGGIVYDSTPEQEYQETLNKAAALLKLIRPASQRY